MVGIMEGKLVWQERRPNLECTPIGSKKMCETGDQKWVPDLVPRSGYQIWFPEVGTRFGPQKWVPELVLEVPRNVEMEPRLGSNTCARCGWNSARQLDILARPA